MISSMDIYLLTRLPKIHIFAEIVLMLGIPTLAALLLFSVIEERKFHSLIGTFKTNLLLFLFLIGFCVKTFLPTVKEAAAIVLIPKIVNNEDVQKIPADAAKLLRLKLEDWIKDFEIELKKDPKEIKQ